MPPTDGPHANLPSARCKTRFIPLVVRDLHVLPRVEVAWPQAGGKREMTRDASRVDPEEHSGKESNDAEQGTRQGRRDHRQSTRADTAGLPAAPGRPVGRA